MNFSAFFRPSRRPCSENPLLQQSPSGKTLSRGPGAIPDAGRSIPETRNFTENLFSEFDPDFRPNMASPGETTMSMRIGLKFGSGGGLKSRKSQL